jgi:hypothetical protein
MQDLKWIFLQGNGKTGPIGIAHVQAEVRLLLAKHKCFDEVIGYAFVFEIPGINALWLDYMAIDMKFQNVGYGTLLFNKIAELNPTIR